MTSFYGFNTHAQGLRDRANHLERIIKIKPTWTLVMDDLAFCQQVKAASAETNVIHRNYAATNGDDDVFKRVTPQTWLDLHKADIDAGMWVMTTCEAGWSQELIDWHVTLMNLCIPRKVKLVIGNWSVGTPEPALISMGKPLFQLCADHPELFVIGLHEYAGGVITSGFTGGAPDGYTQTHDKQYHPDYQRPGMWPLNGEAKILTKWHCGRFQFVVDYCKSVGIKPPRIVLTECAFDNVSDIGWWLNGLPKTSPYPVISGFKSLQEYWKQVFPQWSHDLAFWKQMEYAANNIYNDSPVEGALIYCYGHKDAKWEVHDVEGRTEFLGYVEANAVSIPITPNYTPTAFVAGERYQIVISGTYRNMRKAPSTATGEFVGQVDANAVIIALEQKAVGADYWWRIRVEATGLEGYVSLDGGKVEMRRIVQPMPTVPPPATPPVVIQFPPITLPTSYIITEAERKQVYEAIASMQSAMLTIVNIVGGLQEQIVDKAA